MNLLIFIVIFIVAFLLSRSHYLAVESSSENDQNSVSKPAFIWVFMEIFRLFVNYFLGLLIGYYFILVRWNPIIKGDKLLFSDFILLVIFLMCIMGWMPYFLKNITEGIDTIIKRILKEKI